MADQIAYDYSSLGQHVDDMKKIVSTIESEIDDLNSQSQQALQNWQGDGSQGYQQDLNGIKNDLGTIDSTLNQLAQSITDGSDAFKGADAKIAQSFGS